MGSRVHGCDGAEAGRGGPAPLAPFCPPEGPGVQLAVVLSDRASVQESLQKLCLISIDHAAGLWREHHDQVAKFMAAMGPRGAEEALRLSGLSLREELRLACGAGQLRRAQHCLEALAWGSGDRATLNAFPLWQSHTIDTLLGGGAGGEQGFLCARRQQHTLPYLSSPAPFPRFPSLPCPLSQTHRRTVHIYCKTVTGC